MPSPYLQSAAAGPPVAEPSYSWLGDKMRQAASHQMACVLGCGGIKCKYCVPDNKFSPKDFVVSGVYSNWIPPHFLAISRPSTRAVSKYKIVQQFTDLGVKSIINLQTPGLPTSSSCEYDLAPIVVFVPGEHNKCGYPLEPSGFSYHPEQFMDNGIFFYNYAWPDFGVPDIDELLDAVQVSHRLFAN